MTYTASLSTGNYMKLSGLFVIFGLFLAFQAQAEIYKRVDKDGHVTYSSEPLKGGKKIHLKPLQVINGNGKEGNRSSTPENFPRVDRETQKRRDETRRIILQDELSSEQKLLESAKASMKDLEDNPVPVVGKDGIPFRGSAEYADKLKGAQNDVSIHEQNIKALETEISSLK